MNRTIAISLVATLLVAGCTFTLDPDQYAPASCRANEKACGYKCVPDDDPATGCRNPGCGACPGIGPNQRAICTPAGACAAACNPGFDACDADPTNGCESRVDTPSACGTCDRICASGNCDSGGYCVPVSASFPSPWQPTGIAVGPGGVAAVAVDPASGAPFLGAVFRVDYTPVPNAVFLTGDVGMATAVAFHPGSVSTLLVGGTTSSTEGMIYETNLTGSAPIERTSPHADRYVASLVGAGNNTWWTEHSFLGESFWGDVFAVPNSPGPEKAVSIGPPVTALAYDGVGNIFAAAGGDILVFEDVLGTTVPAPGTAVAGVGSVTELAWSPPGAPLTFGCPGGCLYWADHTTGDVWRYDVSTISRSRLHDGAATEWMSIAADANGAVWTDLSAGTVMAYSHATGAVAQLGGGGGAVPTDVALYMGMVYWLDLTKLQRTER